MSATRLIKLFREHEHLLTPGGAVQTADSNGYGWAPLEAPALDLLPRLEDEAKERQGNRTDLAPSSENGEKFGEATEKAADLVGIGDSDDAVKAPAEEADAAAAPFTGRQHADVLKLTLDGPAELVKDLIDAGVVGTIAGVPESYKTWLGQAVAVRVAAGAGEILGRPVVTGGPVGYFWQDDSTANEVGRVQAFEHAHPSPPGLPLHWFLNEGVELPRDLGSLRTTIETLGLILVVLDSFYNVANVDLRDVAGGELIKRLKTEVADPTGCTILIVDHMPWATDTNRGRLRAYGDVFKGAATRFGIYIDAERDKLRIEARGNNVRGFKRTPAYWDADRLELVLVDEKKAVDRDYVAEVADYLAQHDLATTGEIVAGIGAREEIVRRTLKDDPRFHLGARRPGVNANAHCWTVSPSGQAGMSWDELAPAPTTGSPSRPSPPVRGTGRDELTGGAHPPGQEELDEHPDEELLAEAERLAEKHVDIAGGLA